MLTKPELLVSLENNNVYGNMSFLNEILGPHVVLLEAILMRGLCTALQKDDEWFYSLHEVATVLASRLDKFEIWDETLDLVVVQIKLIRRSSDV